MFPNKKNDTSSSASVNTSAISTLIGEGCVIKGDITAKNSIKIEGSLHGNLTSEGSVIIGEKGMIKGDVRCTDLLIFGRLEGNINVRQLQLKPAAHIQGNIETQTLQVEPGATYQGGVTMKNPAAADHSPKLQPVKA